MTRRVVWGPDAQAAYDETLAYLAERDERWAEVVRADIDAWVQRVADQLLGTPHSWPNCKTAGLSRRSKRIIYRSSDDRIEIVAFRDTRQDNGAFDFMTPKPFK